MLTSTLVVIVPSVVATVDFTVTSEVDSAVGADEVALVVGVVCSVNSSVVDETVVEDESDGPDVVS